MEMGRTPGSRRIPKRRLRRGAILATAVWLCLVHVPARGGEQTPLDVVILLDDSGSMRQTDPLKLRFSAFSLLIRLLRDDDAVGVVKFDQEATVVVPLRPIGTAKDRRTLDKALASFSTRGAYTNLYAGLKTALQEMQQRGRQHAARAVILLSDGLMDVHPAVMRHEDALRLLRQALLPAYQDAQVRVVTLALSPQADQVLLQDIATVTAAPFHAISQAEELSPALFSVFDALKSPEMVSVKGRRVTLDAAVKEATFFIMTAMAGGAWP